MSFGSCEKVELANQIMQINLPRLQARKLIRSEVPSGEVDIPDIFRAVSTYVAVVVAFFSVNCLSKIEHINLQSEISRSGEMNKALIESETKANQVELTSRRLKNRTR